MRGQLYSQHYFPKTWFGDRLEQPSMTALAYKENAVAWVLYSFGLCFAFLLPSLC